MRKSKDVIEGALFPSNKYGEMQVVRYINQKNVEVVFCDTGTKLFADAGNIRKGNVKDPNSPEVSGVGYFGQGEFTSRKPSGGKEASYQAWVNMLQRCYSPKWHQKYPTYKGCSVCPEWFNFQNFARWFKENYPKDGLKYDLDKDIKLANNKEYSPNTCVFVSHAVNAKKARCKEYSFVSPTGEVMATNDLLSFCTQYGLNRRSMCSVALEERAQHKGWTRYFGSSIGSKTKK